MGLITTTDKVALWATLMGLKSHQALSPRVKGFLRWRFAFGQIAFLACIYDRGDHPMMDYEKPRLVRMGTVEEATQLGMRHGDKKNPPDNGGDDPLDSFS